MDLQKNTVIVKCCSNETCAQVNPQLIENFSKSKNTKDGRQFWCKLCNKTYRQLNHTKVQAGVKAWVKAHPNEARSISRDYRMRSRYGISMKDKQHMYDNQSGKCANTGCDYAFKNLSDAHTDHNHKTKAVRGLLCGPCNRALGLLKENCERIIGLARYTQDYEGII
jgi:hypothetical protein